MTATRPPARPKTVTDEELTEPQVREVLRVVDGLRRAIEAAVTLRAPLDELTSLAARTHALADALAARSGQRPVPRFTPEFDARDPNATIAFSPVTGRFSPLAPPVEVSVEAADGDGPPRIIGVVSLGDAYEGPPSCVHGGVIAAVYDQLLSLAGMACAAGGPTATLTVQFRRPTPLHVPLRFEAWVERLEGRKVFTRGTCHAGGELLSESDGLFVRYRG
jgi:hypothetical protein